MRLAIFFLQGSGVNQDSALLQHVASYRLWNEISDGDSRFHPLSYVCGGYVKESQVSEEYGVTGGALEAFSGRVIPKH